MTSRRLSLYFLFFVFLSARETYSMFLIKPLIKYGMPALPFITTFAYHMVSYIFVIKRVDHNVRVVKRDVRILKQDTRILKEGVREVKRGVSNLEKETKTVKHVIQTFKQETHDNLQDVRSDILVTRTKLLQKIVDKEKSLSNLIRTSEKNLKKEIREKYTRLIHTLEDIEKRILKLAMKQDLELLKSLVTDLDAKMNNLREDIIASIKESESRQKIFFKDHINGFKKNNNTKFSLLQKYIAKLETSNDEIKDLISKNNQNIGNLNAKITTIGSEVNEIKKILTQT